MNNNASKKEAQDAAETTTIVITVPPDPLSFSSLYDVPIALPPTTTDSDFTDAEGEITSNGVTVSVQEKTIPETERHNDNNEQKEEEGTDAMEPMQQGDTSLSEEAPLVDTCPGSNKGDTGLASDSSTKQNTSRTPSTVEQIKGGQTEPEIPIKPTTPVKRTSSTSSTGSTPVKEAAPMTETASGLPVPLAKSISDTSSYKVKQDSVQYSVTLPKTKSNKVNSSNTYLGCFV